MLKNTHPGDVLREEFIEPYGMTAYKLAKALGVQRTAVGQLLAGKRSVTPLMALALTGFVGTHHQLLLQRYAPRITARSGVSLVVENPAVLPLSTQAPWTAPAFLCHTYLESKAEGACH